MDVLKTIEEKAFWGHEFLTWLWYRIETTDGDLEVDGVGPVALWVEDRLTLTSLETESRENILKDGDVANSAEAAAALSVGKKVEEVRLGMSREDREYRFGLRGESLDLTTVKVPGVDSDEEEDWHGTALVRYALLRDILRVLDGLFAEFLRLRTTTAWPDTVAGMTRWVSEKEGG